MEGLWQPGTPNCWAKAPLGGNVRKTVKASLDYNLGLSIAIATHLDFWQKTAQNAKTILKRF